MPYTLPNTHHLLLPGKESRQSKPLGEEISQHLSSCFTFARAVVSRVEEIGCKEDDESTPEAKQEALRRLREEVQKLRNELEVQQQKLTVQTELLIHSKMMKANLLNALSKLHPHIGEPGQVKFHSLLKQINWELRQETDLNYEKDFDQLHGSLYEKLERICPGISQNEKRLCAYLKTNHRASDIARITNRSLNSINVAFSRLRAKLRIPGDHDLRQFIQSMESS